MLREKPIIEQDKSKISYEEFSKTVKQDKTYT